MPEKSEKPHKSPAAAAAHHSHAPSRSRNSRRPAARLEGALLLHGRHVNLAHEIASDALVMGRSDPDAAATDPFKPVKRDGVHLGLGTSPKLSRAHLKIQFDPAHSVFLLQCLGKNGVTVVLPHPDPDHHPHVDPDADPDADTDANEHSLVPASDPIQLCSDAEIKVAGCSMKFFLVPSQPEHHVSPAPSTPRVASSKSRSSAAAAAAAASSSASSGKRKRREWTKSEHIALRTQMMRFGYGRWDAIIAGTSSRLTERHEHEVVPVARRFVATCYVHARPGVERKALMEILRQNPREGVSKDPEAIEADIAALLESVTAEIIPSEQRKYVRWARKLRILSRLNDVHDHSSMKRLRRGELRVFTPPPTLYWTPSDDADLILGSYRHGYGAVEAIRTDPDLGFVKRYSKTVSSKKAATPSKPNKSAMDTGNASDEDEDDDEDADEDEDERKALDIGNDEDSKGPSGGAAHNPKKRQKLGDGTAKSEEARTPQASRSSEGANHVNEDGCEGSTPAASSAPPSDRSPKPDQADDEKAAKKARLVPKRGPRIGNEDGYNDPEDARVAFEAAADEDGLAPFPYSEFLMRRLKSVINSCAKEYDRDQRELRKKQLAASRARQRKNDLAEKKAIKEAEKTRQRAERRIAKSQPFSKKEAVEFEKALSNFGISYLEDKKTVDWVWFHSKVDGFDAKYAETMWSAYVELLAEAHRIRDLAAAKEDEDFETVDRLNATKKPSTVFSTLTVERAERLIDRLQFFRNLRGEVLSHPNLTNILRGFKKTKDLPPWWKSSQDKSLLLGVDRYGLNGFEEMGLDPQLAFASSMKAWQRKNASDSKTVKRAVMPKTNSGVKRAFALVRYFSSRANDPHFEIYHQAENGTSAVRSDREDDVDGSGVKMEVAVAGRARENVVMEEAEEERTRVRAPREVSKRKIESSGSLAQAPSGRPRTLRHTVIHIPKDKDGILILPANLGDGLILLNLGEVAQGDGFCKNGIIYPVGFRSIRQVGGRVFLCEIVADASKTRPEFRVSEVFQFDEKARDEDFMWETHRVIAKGGNLVTVWMEVANETLGSDGAEGRIALACGAERFGLYEPTIVYHLQRLPGARYVAGFELRDFSQRGRGAKREPSVGILDAMLKALDSKLEAGETRSHSDGGLSEDDEWGRDGAVLADEAEMSVPPEWVELYSGQRRKQRRRSSSYLA